MILKTPGNVDWILIACEHVALVHDCGLSTLAERNADLVALRDAARRLGFDLKSKVNPSPGRSENRATFEAVPIAP